MILKLAISFRSGCISLVSSPESFHLRRGEGRRVTDRWPVFRTFGDCGGNLFESSRRCQWSLYASGGWTSSCVRCEASFLPAKSPVSSYRICTIAMAAFRFAPHTIKYLALRRRNGPEVMEDALRGRTNACRGSCKLQEAELQINSHPPQYRKGSLRWSLRNTIWNQNSNLHIGISRICAIQSEPQDQE